MSTVIITVNTLPSSPWSFQLFCIFVLFASVVDGRLIVSLFLTFFLFSSLYLISFSLSLYVLCLWLAGVVVVVVVVVSNVVTAVVRRHASHVHAQELSQLFPHRAERECLQCAACQTTAGLQLDPGRHPLPERAEIRLGKFSFSHLCRRHRRHRCRRRLRCSRSIYLNSLASWPIWLLCHRASALAHFDTLFTCFPTIHPRRLASLHQTPTSPFFFSD